MSVEEGTVKEEGALLGLREMPSLPAAAGPSLAAAPLAKPGGLEPVVGAAAAEPVVGAAVAESDRVPLLGRDPLAVFCP